jgi:putative endonuclease
MIHCYILKLNNDTHYCGITKDITKRFAQHQSGKSKSTKKYLPVNLVWLNEFYDMKSARIIEVQIKKQGVTRWLIKNVGIDLPKLYVPAQEQILISR